MATTFAEKNGSRWSKFDWSNSSKANIAREMIKRNREDRTEPMRAEKADLVSSCMICEQIVKHGSEYLRSGENSQKLAHYDCIWGSLPAAEARALRTAFESGGRESVPESSVSEKSFMRNKKQEVEDDEISLETLASLNHKMGKLEAEVEALRRENADLKKQNDRLSDDLSKCNEAIRAAFLEGLKQKK